MLFPVEIVFGLLPWMRKACLLPGLALGLLCFGNYPVLKAQTNISGQVIDARGAAIPFVNIVVNRDAQRGTTTDIDGRFSLPADPPVRSLRFSFVGYRDLEMDLDTVNTTSPWRVQLQAQTYEFSAVEVVAGINPADLIMRKVIQNRHRNDPEELDSYRCRTYNKVVAAWLPQQEALLEKWESKKRTGDTLSLNRRQEKLLQMMRGADDHHLFIMESLTERLFRHPADYAETILSNRVAGLSEAPFTALANDVQPFSFYQEEVMLLNKAYLNPVSPGSPERYFFHVEDTLYRQQDTVYLLTFHPRRQKNFNGLKGVLYINTHRYALQNIVAEPADTGLIHFRIEQLYDRPDGEHWFPAQLNYEIRLTKYPHPQIGLQLSGKSYIREVALNIPLDPESFQRAERYVFADSAHVLPPQDWSQYRPQPLDSIESRTYEVVDSLGEAHNFDRVLDRLEGLGRGRWSMGLIDLSLPRLLQINQYESVRLGLGLYTSDKLSSWFTLGGYAGYGFGDRDWKYGGEIRFFPDWDMNWEWRWFFEKDIREAGGHVFPLENNLITRRLFAARMDASESFGTFFRSIPLRYLEVGAELVHHRLRPFYPYAFRSEPEAAPGKEFQFSEIGLYFRYAYGQHFRRVLGQRVPDGKEIPYPSLSVALKRGLGTQWKGDYPYWQAWAALDQSFRLIRLGKTSYRLEAGIVEGDVPISRLYTTSGLGRNFQWLTVGRIFQTMDPYEFLSDRYFSFFFRQEFGTLLFKTKWLQPSISLEHHFTIGNLSQPEQHEEVTFNTLEKGYAEAGLIIDNIFRLNYVNVAYLGFGGGAYYRYGAYHLPGGAGKNLAFRLSLAVDF